MFDAIDEEDELKRRGPEVRYGRRSNMLAAESVRGDDAHCLMYGTNARKPIEKKMTAHQAAKEVKKKLRLNFKSLATAFRQADADKSGGISPRELRCMVYWRGGTFAWLRMSFIRNQLLHHPICVLTAHDRVTADSSLGLGYQFPMLSLESLWSITMMS